MRFFEFYRKRYIAGIEPDEFKGILAGNNTDTKPFGTSSGTVILSNGTVVNCVGTYYAGSNIRPANMLKGSNRHLMCRQVRENLELSDIGDMECCECHICCLERAEAGILWRIK